MDDDDYEDEEPEMKTREYNLEWLDAERNAFIEVRDINKDG